MQTIVNNLLINYEIYGLNNSCPIVILHGWHRDLNEWQSIAKELADKNKVVLIDLPGFGKSQLPNSTYGVEEYAQLVTDFLKKIGISKYILMGHSFGGRISLVLSASTKNVVKLILVASAGIEPRPKVYNFLINCFRPIKRLFPKRFLRFYAQLFGSKNFKSAQSLKKIFLKVINKDLSHLLPNISANTLIIWGSNDKILDCSISKAFKSAIKKSLIRIVWGAGHHPHIDKPQEFINIVKEFIYDK